MRLLLRTTGKLANKRGSANRARLFFLGVSLGRSRTFVGIAAVFVGMLVACNTASLPQDAFFGGPSSSLTISPSTLVADGLSQAWIVLHVRDRAGAPVANVRPSFFLEPQMRHVWLVQPGPTDSRGKTTGIVLSQTPGTMTVATHLPILPGGRRTTLRAMVEFVGPS